MVLVLVISFVEERRAYIYDRLHLIDGVIDVVCAQIRCKRVHNGTHLKAGQVNNAEICPFGHLKGNDVAILHADFLQPRCELACAGINLLIRKLRAQIVLHIGAVTIFLALLIPDVCDSLVSPIATLVIEFFRASLILTSVIMN